MFEARDGSRQNDSSGAVSVPVVGVQERYAKLVSDIEALGILMGRTAEQISDAIQEANSRRYLPTGLRSSVSETDDVVVVDSSQVEIIEPSLPSVLGVPTYPDFKADGIKRIPTIGTHVDVRA